MSIHAAKGLEFPVVVIGDAQYKGRSRDRMLVDSKLGVLLPLKDADGKLSAIYDFARKSEKDQDQAETNRLLYVAATRAQERLIFSGCMRLKKDTTPGNLSGWLKQIAGADALNLAAQRITHDNAGAKEIKLDLKLPNAAPVACIIYEPNYQTPIAAGSTMDAIGSQAIMVPPPLLLPIALNLFW